LTTLFVPEHRTLSFQNTSRCSCPGQELNDGPLFRLPYGSIHPYAITAPLIGMAEGAYESYVGYTRGRIRASYVGEKAAETASPRSGIARRPVRSTAAWLHLDRNISEEYDLAAAGRPIPMELRPYALAGTR
jgi:3-hydroxy-9,10-secoandrosta-1,3,5(10)-triene-9,17-dione monooxygenase